MKAYLIYEETKYSKKITAISVALTEESAKEAVEVLRKEYDKNYKNYKECDKCKVLSSYSSSDQMEKLLEETKGCTRRILSTDPNFGNLIVCKNRADYVEFGTEYKYKELPIIGPSTVS